jgi:6-phosphogluconolactonase (cycloisomerase 2 family)
MRTQNSGKKRSISLESGALIFGFGLASPRRAVLVSVFLGLLFGGSASAQNVSLSSGKLTFSNQVKGTTSAIKNVTLTNTDPETALTLKSIAASGDFIQTHTCGTSVAPSGNCTISVQFAPNTVGTIEGSVNIVDDAPGSPQLIELVGSGIAQTTVSPSSLSFGTVSIGSTSPVKTVKLTNNTGSLITLTTIAASGDYTATAATTGGCGTSLAASASCIENVTFTPTSLGNVNGSVTFKDSATGSPQFVTLSGTGSGTANSPIALTPPSLAFGNLAVGSTSIVKPVTIKNKGLSSLAITITPSAGYTESSPPTVGCGAILAGGASCTINVQFAPTVLGTIDGGIKIGYVGANSPQVVSLTGNGIGQVTVSPASLTFPAQLAGTTSPTKNVTVTNNTGATINVSSIAKSGDFTETNTCGGGIGAGKSCTVSVGFAPSSGGSILGSIVITDGATNSPQIVNLSGSSPMVPRFAYVTNPADNTVSMYTVNVTTGQLRNNGYVFAGNGPGGVTVDPSNKFAYVTNLSSSNVSAYTINASNGRLTAVANSPFPAGILPSSVTVHPSGKFAYVTNGASNDISGYTINAATGALAPMSSTFPSGLNPNSMTVDPTGKFAYVSNSNDSPGTISAYTINATTGALAAVPGSPFLSQGNAISSVTLTPSGKFAYVTNNEGNIGAFSVNPTTGALKPITGSPFSTGSTQPFSMTVDPSGRFAYVGNVASISVYAINAATGALAVVGSPLPIGTGIVLSLTVDPTDQFLCVGNTKEIWTYGINSASGALTLLKTVRTRRQSASLVLSKGTTPVTYTPKFAYVANNGSNNVSAYAIDDDTGVIAAITGSPFPAGSTPASVTTDPSGKFAYVANFSSKNISAYTINARTGFLAPITGSPFPAGTGPVSAAVDPSGRFAYVANQGGSISAYTIDPSTGFLTPIPGSPFPTGANTELFSVTVDPTGQFVYVANFAVSLPTVGSIFAYTIDVSTGALTPITGSPFTTQVSGPTAVTVDPSGKFLFVTNGTPNPLNYTVFDFAIDATTGALAMNILPAITAANPAAVTVDPSDRFVYVADAGANLLYIYSLDATNGDLTNPRSIPAFTNPNSVAVDASAKFVYAAAPGVEGGVNAYTIDQGTGDLARITGSPFRAGTEPTSVTTTTDIH